MKRILRRLTIVAGVGALSIGLWGCEPNDDLEDAADNVEDAVEEAVEDAGDAVEEAGDAVEDASDG